MNLEFAAITYRTLRDRIRAEDPKSMSKPSPIRWRASPICMRSSLPSSARHWPTKRSQQGSKSRIAEMQGRLERLQDRASKRRQIAKDVMVELDLKKITAPDFTVSIRPGLPSLAGAR